MENGSLRQPEIGAHAQEHDARKHRDQVAKNARASPFWRELEQLIPPPYTRNRLMAFFNKRATYGQIRHWRYGCTPPPWAIEIVRKEARARIAKLESAATLKMERESNGARGTRHLAAWRERKARERDEKENQK